MQQAVCYKLNVLVHQITIHANQCHLQEPYISLVAHECTSMLLQQFDCVITIAEHEAAAKLTSQVRSVAYMEGSPAVSQQ